MGEWSMDWVEITPNFSFAICEVEICGGPQISVCRAKKRSDGGDGTWGEGKGREEGWGNLIWRFRKGLARLPRGVESKEPQEEGVRLNEGIWIGVKTHR